MLHALVSELTCRSDQRYGDIMRLSGFIKRDVQRVTFPLVLRAMANHWIIVPFAAGYTNSFCWHGIVFCIE